MPESKSEQIDRAKANLPLPEDPPRASDFNSADARTTNVGSGRTEAHLGTEDASTAGLRGPGTKRSENVDMSNIGRQGVEGLSHPPKDAASK
ncbi:hypothetical protein MY10362_006843 [Beauveria mimosiformis]